MFSQVLAHQHSAPLEKSIVKKILTCIRSWKQRTAKRKVLLETLLLTLSLFFQPTSNSMSSPGECATSRSPFSSPSSCIGHGLHHLQENTIQISIRPIVSHPGRDYPCTFLSLVDPRGSHLPEERLSFFSIWNNSTSKPTKTNKVSELRCRIT